ncbi:MAG: PAS domain-containing sensor histidine kinase, partial [Pseudomonadota bacterium]
QKDFNIIAVDQNASVNLLHILTKNQNADVGKTIVIAAVFDFKNYVNIKQASGFDTIQHVKIINQDTSDSYYEYYKRQEKSGAGFAQYTDTKIEKIANQDVGIEVGLNLGTRESFLQKIPLLMLLFGVTLTLIGTLYVRNNQMQSKKLSKMNKELAHKNFELNQQISERERLNDVIQKSAKEHQTIINAVSDIIVELSDQGVIQFLNDAWKTVTGFDLDRSIGRSIFDMIYVQDQAELKNNIQELVNGTSRSYRTFTRIRSADGKFRAVEMSLSLVRETADKDLHLVGTITDVEERRRAERALSEAEKKYRTIVENAAGGIYQVTPEGQLLSVNPAYARILKYESADIVLRDIKNATDEIYDDPMSRSSFLKDIANLNISKSKEMLVKRADGKVIWVNENVRPVFDEENNLLYYEGSMEDVDKRKKAELALKEAKTGSDLANRAKSEFLANMSHELRTPLNAIIGFSDIIRTEAFGKIEQEEYKEYSSSIFDSGNNLLKVINEILDVSRIDAGERTLNEGAINVRESVLSSLSLMEGKIKSAKVRIENKVVDTDLGIIGEGQALKQMILNLMSNAVKFSPPGGMVMLDVEVIDDGRLRLSVTDTGIGMNDVELEKALSPFGQVEAEHSRSGSGTGLGLTLVKSLIELHGGELEIVSQKGIGTTATLIFPAKRVIDKNKKVTKDENETV